MLVYNPYYSQTGEFRRKGTRFLASQTSCPYKVVSVEEGNSLILTCPYANIYDLFDLGNADNQFGTVFLYVFSTLLGATADEAVKYTVFARFINPQFFVPTQKDVMAEMRDKHELARLEKRGYRYAQSDVVPVASRDTGETQTQGPVANATGAIATVADALSSVPVIGQVASSVAWVSRMASKTASVFGWSKPTTLNPQSKVVIKPTNALIHTEGHDDATTLSLIQDNGIDGSSFIPEDKDEMSFAYTLGRPNYFHAQTVNSEGFSARKLITSWEVSPLSQYQYGNLEDSQTMFLGNFAYTSMMATLWRGTINYDIMIVKTPFHQGRFAVVFLPETNISEVPETLDQVLTTNYNVVCNLKDRQDEMGRTNFRIAVPYVSNTGWRETYKRTSNVSNPGPDATTSTTKTGCLAIYSLVDLSSPPTVASTVTFYIAHSAGDDYQLARPVMNLAPGYQSRYASAQSDIGPVFIPEDENLLISSHTTQDVTAQTTGEYFESFRAFIKRFGKFANLSQTKDYVGMRTRTMAEDPKSGARTMSRDNFTDKILPTPWYMASFLYRFYNGSSQLKLIPPTPAMFSEAFLKFDDSLEHQAVIDEIDSFGQPVYPQLQQVSNAYEVRTPYYRAVRCDVVNSTQVPQLGDVRTCVRSQNLGGYGTTSATTPLYEAAGDDFNFFFLIGPPPMCDIRNVRATSTFPTGNAYTISTAAVTSTNETDDYARFFTVSFTPTYSLESGEEYNITQSEIPTVTVTYNDDTTEDIPLTDCKLSYTVSGNALSIPKNPNKTIDLAVTAISVVSLGSFDIITDMPQT